MCAYPTSLNETWQATANLTLDSGLELTQQPLDTESDLSQGGSTSSEFFVRGNEGVVVPAGDSEDAYAFAGETGSPAKAAPGSKDGFISLDTSVQNLPLRVKGHSDSRFFISHPSIETFRERGRYLLAKRSSPLGLLARHQLVARHQGWVCKIAREYARSGHSFDTLVQEGNIGLLRALDLFDPDRGFTFSTYSGWWIRYFINHFLKRENKAVNVPRLQQKRGRMLEELLADFFARTGQAASVEELAAISKLTEQQVEGALEANRVRVSSLDETPKNERGRQPLIEMQRSSVASPEDEASFDAELRPFLFALPPTQRRVIELRGSGMVLREIADIMGVSRQLISFIEGKAKARLQVLAGRPQKPKPFFPFHLNEKQRLAVIEKLTTEERALYDLAYVQGIPQKEIAARLLMNPARVFAELRWLRLRVEGLSRGRPPEQLLAHLNPYRRRAVMLLHGLDPQHWGEKMSFTEIRRILHVFQRGGVFGRNEAYIELRSLILSDAKLIPLEVPDSATASQLTRDAEARRLQAIGNLKPEERVLYDLAIVQRMSHREIAARLQMRAEIIYEDLLWLGLRIEGLSRERPPEQLIAHLEQYQRRTIRLLRGFDTLYWEKKLSIEEVGRFQCISHVRAEAFRNRACDELMALIRSDMKLVPIKIPKKRQAASEDSVPAPSAASTSKHDAAIAPAETARPVERARDAGELCDALRSGEYAGREGRIRFVCENYATLGARNPLEAFWDAYRFVAILLWNFPGTVEALGWERSDRLNSSEILSIRETLARPARRR